MLRTLQLFLAMILAVEAHAELLSPVKQPAPSPSNFSVDAWLIPSDTPSTEPPVGAFRFVCNVAKLGRFDPIVYPGQPSAGHMHTFFGNTKVTASSTYESLRNDGDSSCQGGPLNRSAYWMPTVMRSDGKAIIPMWIGIYYKGEPSTSTGPKSFGITDHTPRGLRYVFGFDMERPRAQRQHEWLCYSASGTHTQTYGSIPEVLADRHGCPPGGTIVARIPSPPCWDGRLDSPNHRDHMAYGSYGGWGYYRCPATHSRRLPQFTVIATFSYDSPDELKTWFLSSDRMPGMPEHKPGSTLHADWLGAWDDGIMAIWHTHCIEKMLSCSGFVLGNGKAGKSPAGFTFNQQPRVVVPPIDDVMGR